MWRLVRSFVGLRNCVRSLEPGSMSGGSSGLISVFFPPSASAARSDSSCGCVSLVRDGGTRFAMLGSVTWYGGQKLIPEHSADACGGSPQMSRPSHQRTRCKHYVDHVSFLARSTTTCKGNALKLFTTFKQLPVQQRPVCPKTEQIASHQCAEKRWCTKR